SAVVPEGRARARNRQTVWRSRPWRCCPPAAYPDAHQGCGPGCDRAPGEAGRLRGVEGDFRPEPAGPGQRQNQAYRLKGKRVGKTWVMGGEIAGAVRTVELLFHNASPAVLASVGRTGHAKFDCVVGYAAKRAGLQR